MMIDIWKIDRKISNNPELLGWKGICGGDFWQDDEYLHVSYEVNSKKIKRISKTCKDRMKKMTLADEVDFFDEGHTGTPFIVLSFLKSKVRARPSGKAEVNDWSA